MPKSIFLTGLVLILWSLSFGQVLQIDSTQAQLLAKLGNENKQKGQYVEAGQNYLDAGIIYEYHNQWSDYLSMLNDAADSYRRAGKLQKADQIALNSIAAGKTHIENPSFQVAKAYHTLGIIKDYLSQFDEAIEINNLALDIYLALDVKPLVIADIYNSLGVNYLHLADHYRSLENLQKTLEIFQQHLDPRHQKVADLYLNMGSTYLAMGKYELAREYYEQEMSITTENMGAEHPELGETSNNLGTVHAYLGNIELSES